MTLSLYFCLLILLMMTLISLQYPLSLLNSCDSENNYPSIQGLVYKENEGISHDDTFKRQVNDDTSKNQHDLNTLENVARCNERNKRLEKDDEVNIMEGNQFYKPLNEETKEIVMLGGCKNGKEDKSYPQIALPPDISSLAKLPAANNARSQRQARGGPKEFMNLNPKNVEMTYCLRDKSQSADELDSSSGSGNSVQRKTRKNCETVGLIETHRLGAETLETIKKINPLTIGDQVSQMIHDRKCNPKNNMQNIKSTLVCSSNAEQNEDQTGCQQDNDDATKLPPCLIKMKPAVVERRPGNENDFPVVLFPGDPLIKGSESVGKSPRGEITVVKENNSENKQKYSGGSSNEDTSQTNNHNLNSFLKSSIKKELLVEKVPNLNVEFPVYDQDLSDVPDPFNGLLEQNYGAYPVHTEGETTPHGGERVLSHRSIVVREAPDKMSKSNGNNSLKKKDKTDGADGVYISNDSESNSEENSMGDKVKDTVDDGSNDNTNSAEASGTNSGGNAQTNTNQTSSAPSKESLGGLDDCQNNGSCMSWNDDVKVEGCGKTTTVKTTTETPTPEACNLEPPPDNTCCPSWKKQILNSTDSRPLNLSPLDTNE